MRSKIDIGHPELTVEERREELSSFYSKQTDSRILHVLRIHIMGLRLPKKYAEIKAEYEKQERKRKREERRKKKEERRRREVS